MNKKYNYALIHKSGCKKVAFLYDRFPQKSDHVLNVHALLLNGEKPVSGEPIICGTCLGNIPQQDLLPENVIIKYEPANYNSL